MEYEELLNHTRDQSRNQINKLHLFSKKLWSKKHKEPVDIINQCLDTWEDLGDELGTRFKPLITIDENRPVTNVIFGSGSFSTGNFQVEQYNQVYSYASNPPIRLEGIVSNKSESHGCNGAKIARKFNIPLVELDFIDWYHNNIDKNESNPIRASRYWYPPESKIRPDNLTIAKNFRIRQNEFHKELGENIGELIKNPIDTVSARGYNFQFCRNIFKSQRNELPCINDTHPADLRFINQNTQEKLYAGWQSEAIQLMLNDKIHNRYRGSLITVNNMDNLSQIHELDEGALLAIGSGIEHSTGEKGNISAKQIQNLMKIKDDYLFCTLEPTGMLLFWGISETPISVDFYTKEGKLIQIEQHAVIVGNTLRSGNNAWGVNIDADIRQLEQYIFP